MFAAAAPASGQVNGDGGNQANANQGPGGGTAADFDSLMELIQTIVVPETWDALGGPSSMSPYPQGVYVDAAGTLHDTTSPVVDSTLDQVKRMLASSNHEPLQPGFDWMSASRLRCVSLRRLLAEKSRLSPVVPPAIDFLAGLSEVQYVIFTPDDIVIAGPVNGIEFFQGWPRDRESGRTAIRLDFLSTCLTAAAAQQPFGCTIDPTVTGLQNAVRVAARIQQNSIPLGMAAEALGDALGMQSITVFGTAADTPIGYIMVEADRHMKQLALGVHDMPGVGKNYLRVIEESIGQGPPQDLLLRLWFTAQRREVRTNADRTVFELTGTPVRLSGQNERALANGQRGQPAVDPRTETFVAEFNQWWPEIRSQYPIQAALESIYQSASVAELICRNASSDIQRMILQELAQLDNSDRYGMPTPRQVESIAVLHTCQQAQTKHHILIASGGVKVATPETLAMVASHYPALDSTTSTGQPRPAVIQCWWWD
jgi:hypothetical protein